MKRGQAFETMMLVISVIVALAILAVLMNIIGGVGGIGAGEPDKLMHDQLKDVVSKGYGYSTAKKAVFTEGSRITTEQVVGQDITSVLAKEIEFTIPKSTDALGTAFTLETSANAGQILVVKEKVEANFVVCGTSSGTQKYKISIARTAGDAATNCVIG